MKKISSKTLMFLIIWTVIITLLPFFASIMENKRYEDNLTYISSEFDIKDYNVVLDVDRDNKIDVTEEFTIQIPEGNDFKGIYKSIPLWQEHYNEEDKVIRQRVKITNLRAIGEKFFLNKESDNIGIKIGSERTNINSGLHTYIIKYRYDMGANMNKSIDELLFNVFENYDNTVIDNMKITIIMPEKVEKSNIAFLDGSKDITNDIDCTIDGNAINILINGYEISNSVEIKIDLPDGYFIGGTYNYGFACMIICFALIIVSVISFNLWKKYGKDYKKRCMTVEFYPPDELDCAQVGSIYGEKSIKKLTAALIIELASKGYILIEEIENGKYKIINIGKDKSGQEQLSINEQTVYLELFKNGDTNILSEDRSFAKVFDKIDTTLTSTTNKRTNDMTARKMKSVTLVMLLTSIIAWLIASVYIRDLDPKFNLLYIVSLVSIFITGFFSIIMEKKTEYGEMITAKVLGFRNYILVAEKDEIDMMVKKNPDYFYEILPYAYALGVSDKWIGQFDKINVPNINLSVISQYENNLFMIV